MTAPGNPRPGAFRGFAGIEVTPWTVIVQSALKSEDKLRLVNSPQLVHGFV